MDTHLSNQAIQSALTQNWNEAIKINLQILEQNKDDVGTLNRLAYAYLKSGNLSSAKTTYRKVLKIDKYNHIAIKNLKWMENLTRSDIRDDISNNTAPTIFLEEPGKTKIVTLAYPAPSRTLCNLMTAQRVFLIAKKHSVEVRCNSGIYIGTIPDDLAHRLRIMMSAGNTYDAYIKNIDKNIVVIFIRELKRGKKFAATATFSSINKNLNRLDFIEEKLTGEYKDEEKLNV